MASRLVTIDKLVAAVGAEHPPTMLDVRDLVESERGHIPGATILPRRRIEFRIAALVRDPATPLIVVDSGDDIDEGRRDPRAALAAETLSALGYRDVQALDGGVAAWRGGGGVVSRG
jgi:rhodanese-related sulfurtransferase